MLFAASDVIPGTLNPDHACAAVTVTARRYSNLSPQARTVKC